MAEARVPGIVERVAAMAETDLWPRAQETDLAPILPAANIDALRRSGAFGAYGPEGVTPNEQRAIHRALGGACGVTYFVWAQHRGPAQLLSFSPNFALRDELLPRMGTGEIVGGTAFAHLRRPGRPLLVATPAVGGGWAFDGEAPWATGWGIAAVYSVAAKTADGSQVVWGLVDGRRQPGLVASAPLDLACMQATSTVRLRFDGFEVPADRVLLELDANLWGSIDDGIANRLNPAVLGVADRAILLLDDLGTPATADAAGRLLEAVAACSREDESLPEMTDLAGAFDLEAMARTRAWSLDLATQATQAYLAAVGGRGMERSHPAQRLVREAAFYVIQAQTAEGREASLHRAAQHAR